MTPPPSVDYIYWTFSAAAQSISAFVAFLVTGYALVHTMMESARSADDTLEEVHSTLRISYHKWLTWLAFLTGLAIVLSLLVVYVNRPGVLVPQWARLLVGILDVAAVAGGLLFVVTIIDPKKYQRAAKRALEEAVSPSTPVAPSNDFFVPFLHLERLVRDYLRLKDLYIPSRGAPRMSFSFRQMIEALRQSENIDSAFYDELIEINKYRNLVFHGHVTEVDASMIERTKEAANRIESLS